MIGEGRDGLVRPSGSSGGAWDQIPEMSETVSFLFGPLVSPHGVTVYFWPAFFLSFRRSQGQSGIFSRDEHFFHVLPNDPKRPFLPVLIPRQNLDGKKLRLIRLKIVILETSADALQPYLDEGKVRIYINHIFPKISMFLA